MPRQRASTNPHLPPPMPSWIVGAMIGMTIMSIASSAIGMGAGIALTTTPLRLK